jgi:hypothetical protein
MFKRNNPEKESNGGGLRQTAGFLILGVLGGGH